MTNSFVVKPIIVYDNADTAKVDIFADNRNKSGVYRWINKVNGSTYVGSSINLSVRFYTYYSLASLVSSKRPIDRALLKHGFSNFKLEILEYCEINQALVREQYYMDNLNPNYNTAKVAGSTLGYKHTPEAIAKMRAVVLSEEVKARKALSTKAATASRKLSILVTNTLTNEKMVFKSLTEAGLALAVSKMAISLAIREGRLLKKVYLISKGIK